MKNDSDGSWSPADHIGCFGGFKIDDPICKKHCALRIRCAIEKQHSAGIEILDELLGSDTQLMKMQ